MTAADDAERVAAALDRLDDGDPRHVVVVTDRPDLLAQRTGPLRRFLGPRRPSAVAVVVPDGDAVPAMCRSLLEIGSIGIARWWPDASRRRPPAAEPVHVAGVAAPTAHAVARALAGAARPGGPGGRRGRAAAGRSASAR